MTTTDYNKQAIDFLNATSTAMICKFKGHGKYWGDNDDERDIFSITLVNKLHRYRFSFGQSIDKSTSFGDNPPTAYDVLSCLAKSDCEDFAYFCSEFGYDPDSRKAYKTYKAVKREWENVKKLWTPEQIELLQDIN